MIHPILEVDAWEVSRLTALHAVHVRDTDHQSAGAQFKFNHSIDKVFNSVGTKGIRNDGTITSAFCLQLPVKL